MGINQIFSTDDLKRPQHFYLSVYQGTVDGPVFVNTLNGNNIPQREYGQEVVDQRTVWLEEAPIGTRYVLMRERESSHVTEVFMKTSMRYWELLTK